MWPETALQGLCEQVVDCPHSTPVWTDSGVTVLRNQNIRFGRLDLSTPSFTDEEHYRRRIRRAEPQPGDIVITREAPMGEVCMIPAGVRCCLGQRMVLLRPDQYKCDGRFLLFALQSPGVQHQILSNEGTGSTVSNLRIPVLEALQIPTPPLPEQRAIAGMLGALDDKIELNRRMNQTLEEITRTIFTSWFVRFDPVRAKAEGRQPEGMDAETAALFPGSFADSELGPIPAGWRNGTLGDIAVNPREGAKPGEVADDTPYIALEHMPRGAIALDDWGTAQGVVSGKFRFRENAILFGKLRPYFHKVGVAPVTGICSTDILVIEPRDPIWFGFLLGHVSSKELVALVDAASTGTKMPRANWSDLARFPVAMPPSDLAAHFD